ncbi:B12-binding domain-containing radical SAM protein [Desulfovibrio sp. TomC]|uniref:B12-binding domain-containing radical SAM protein n=1 Tax=Desulfovibrio sp. TomC TaxID=1562888 RepID=UPI000573B855|nr:B12-binding domain-containing radical SAM protein [Desulfovibrio sp. TomC]KHK00683.1 Radical SAM domain protein [Desulfovibrio sp. TomC]
MKIALVQSWLGPQAGEPVFPIGLASLAASLPGHSVAAFDPNVAGGDPMAALAEFLRDFSPDMTGVSLRNIDSTNTRVNVSYLKPFSDTLAVVRRETTGALVVGGAGFSMFAKAIMASWPIIDYGVALEGETAFAALADALARGNAPSSVPSLFCRDAAGDAFFTGESAKIDLLMLASPDFSLLPLAPYAAVPWGVGVETKRGCALSCVYCPYGFLNGRRYRYKAPKQVAAEIIALRDVHGARRFTFLDSVFNVPVDHARAVLDAMIAAGATLPWSAWFAERGLDRDFLELARRAGCDTVIFSPDAFGDAALKKLGKASSVAEIKAAYRLVRDLGCFEVSYNFFKNPPGQTLSAAVDMVRFIVKARREMGKKAHFELNSIRVEPHTALAKLAEAEGLIAPDTDLLSPVLYSQKKTAYIEKLFDILLRAAGK